MAAAQDRRREKERGCVRKRDRAVHDLWAVPFLFTIIITFYWFHSLASFHFQLGNRSYFLRSFFLPIFLSQQDVEDPRTESLREYCYGLMLPIICSLGIIGNVLNLIVLTRRNMRGTAYIYMRGKSAPHSSIILNHWIPIPLNSCPIWCVEGVVQSTKSKTPTYKRV